MKLNLHMDYMDPVELGRYEWVTVYLPDEVPDEFGVCNFAITVFEDSVYVQTRDELLNHKSGKKVWSRSNGTQ